MIYEIMFAVRGSVIASESEKTAENLKQKLKDLSSKISFEESWGKINIAYKIAGETEAYYFVLQFTTDSTNLKDIELFMRLDKNIIRSLLTKIEKADSEIFTVDKYKSGMDAYYEEKKLRRVKSAPKTRASTLKQLETDLAKNKKSEKSNEEKAKDIIKNDLSL